jgi:hypothetical protein
LKPSRSPLLAAALDVAWSRGKVITPAAIWTADAASEIVQAAENAQVRWVLLESRRSILGRYPRRSVVNKVLTLTAPLPVNVAVLLQTLETIDGPVTCVVSVGAKVTSAIELATGIAGEHQMKVLYAQSEVAGEAIAVVREEAGAAGVLSGNQLIESLPAGTVVIAKDVIDRWQLGYEQLTSGRNIIVVQSAGSQSAPVRPAVELALQAAVV